MWYITTTATRLGRSAESTGTIDVRKCHLKFMNLYFMNHLALPPLFPLGLDDPHLHHYAMGPQIQPTYIYSYLWPAYAAPPLSGTPNPATSE